MHHGANRLALALAAVIGGALVSTAARADDAIVPVGRFAPTPVRSPERSEEPDPPNAPERSSARLEVGPALVTTGEGAGLGATVAAGFGKGSVGARLFGAWTRGEGTRDDGRSTATGDAMSQYGAELTVDLLRRGRIHPILGVGGAALHVSRPDGASGFAGAGTFRAAVEIGLGLEDADVRAAAGLTGGLVGPAGSEIRDLGGYGLATLGLVVGL